MIALRSDGRTAGARWLRLLLCLMIALGAAVPLHRPAAAVPLDEVSPAAAAAHSGDSCGDVQPPSDDCCHAAAGCSVYLIPAPAAAELGRDRVRWRPADDCSVADRTTAPRGHPPRSGDQG